MKKLRITPLNIIAALALAFLIVSFFQPKAPGRHFDMTVFYKVILAGMLVVAFITDMIFRFIFKDLKRIWFVEMVFISLTVILFLILQK
jgi:hypothetical protein